MDGIKWKVDRRKLAERAVREAAATALEDFAEAMLTDANERVPHEEGDLERSGETDSDRENLKVSIFYDTPYAARQHEELEYRHDEGREAKWLENTLKSRGRELGPFVAQAMKRALP